jgi:hypothetical protein
VRCTYEFNVMDKAESENCQNKQRFAELRRAPLLRANFSCAEQEWNDGSWLTGAPAGLDLDSGVSSSRLSLRYYLGRVWESLMRFCGCTRIMPSRGLSMSAIRQKESDAAIGKTISTMLIRRAL